MSQELSEEKIENIKQILREIDISDSNQSIIQDNKNYFNISDGSYRCVMPSQRDQSLAEDIQNSFKRSNLGKYPTKKQYKIELKEKQNVDIDALEEERLKLKEKLQACYLTHAVILTNETEKLEKSQIKLKETQSDLINIIVEIENHLSPCLEQRSTKKYNEFLAFACTEKMVLDGDKDSEARHKWIPAYESFEAFEKDRTALANKAIQHMQSLIMNIRD